MCGARSIVLNPVKGSMRYEFMEDELRDLFLRQFSYEELQDGIEDDDEEDASEDYDSDSEEDSEDYESDVA